MAFVIENPPVVIQAPCGVVWRILADFNRYPQWNPLTFKIDGELRVGAPLVLHVRLSERHKRLQKEVLTDLEPGLRLAWSPTFLPFLLKAKRWQVLESQDPQQTIYRTWESFAGLLSPLVIWLYRQDIQKGFWEMSQALKKRAETLHQI
ncbi:MAG: SRPBCC family protein [Saprospiraceae bacterium]